MTGALPAEKAHPRSPSPSRYDERLARLLESLVAVNMPAQHGARLLRVEEGAKEVAADGDAVTRGGASGGGKGVNEEERRAARGGGGRLRDTALEPQPLPL